MGMGIGYHVRILSRSLHVNDERGLNHQATARSPEDETLRLRSEFRAAVDRSETNGTWFFPGYFALLFAGILLKPCPGWTKLFPLGVGLIGVGMLVTAIRSASLFCPACRGSLTGEIGPHCPECGEQAVEPAKGWFRAAQCRSCQKPLRTGKHRSFKLNACTHCGFMLNG